MLRLDDAPMGTIRSPRVIGKKQGIAKDADPLGVDPHRDRGANMAQRDGVGVATVQDHRFVTDLSTLPQGIVARFDGKLSSLARFLSEPQVRRLARRCRGTRIGPDEPLGILLLQVGVIGKGSAR